MDGFDDGCDDFDSLGVNDSIALGEADSREDGDTLTNVVGLNDGIKDGFFDRSMLGDIEV